MASGQYDALINVGVSMTNAVNDIKSQLQTMANTAEKQLNSGTAKGVSKGMQQGATTGASVMNKIVSQLQNRFTLTIAQGIINGFTNAVSDAIDNVKELNAAQTEFRKVSDISTESLQAYTKQAAELGREVGRTGRYRCLSV